nr:uncharacterized protein LOC129279838 isoform X1 [Lytechinus pictus]
MVSIGEMVHKGFIMTLCMLVAFHDLTDAARNRNKPRRNRLNKQFKRQRNSESNSDRMEGRQTDNCADLNKKVLKLKYDREVDSNSSASFVMWPTPARPIRHGVAFPSPTPARMSTCPSLPLEQNMDGDRWPRIIMVARCECENCYLGSRAQRSIPQTNDDEDDNCPADETPNPAGYCRPIERDIAVLRKSGCAGDFAQYTWGTERVTVGCECVIGPRPE